MVCCWVHLLWHFRLVLVSEPKSFYPILRKVWCDLGSLVDGILSSQTSLWYYFSRCCSVFLRSLEFGLPRNCFRCIRMLLFMLVWKTHTHIYSLHLGCGLKPNQPPRNHGRHASIPDFRSRSLRESFHPLYYAVVLEHVIYIPDPVLRVYTWKLVGYPLVVEGMSCQHLKVMKCPRSEARGGCATSWVDPATHGEEGAFYGSCEEKSCQLCLANAGIWKHKFELSTWERVLF